MEVSGGSGSRKGGAHLVKKTPKLRKTAPKPQAKREKAPIKVPKNAPKPVKIAKNKPVKKPEKRKKNNNGVPKAPLVVGGVLLILLGGLYAFPSVYTNILPGVQAGGISVGGMTLEQAQKAIAQQAPRQYEAENVTVTIYDTDYDMPAKDLIQQVDAAQSAADAIAVGRSYNPLVRFPQLVRSLMQRENVPLTIDVDEGGLTGQLGQIEAQALTAPVEPTWEIGETALTVHAGRPGVSFDTAAVEQALYQKILQMDFSPYDVTTALTETPAIDLDQIAAAVVGDAVSAMVDKTDGTTIIPEKIGVQFDLEKAKEIVGDGSAESYSIPIVRTMPAVTAEQLSQVLFRDTLAYTATDLNEGNAPRTNNIRLAAASMNGLILNPGDSFSYNGVVGERTAERGYQPAGAYSNGQVIEEFGGGVCQPSSTLYMAVLRADLEVTARSNHMFTVSYTPLGEDATVDYGNIDFCFRNNTAYPVKIYAEQSGGQMKITLVGTKTTDKSVTTRTVVNATYEPSTVEKQDSSMYVGNSRVEQTGITGYSTTTYQVITENGQTKEVLANNSSYTKRDRIVYVGTQAVPQASSSDEEDEDEQQTSAAATDDAADDGDPEGR